jgi:5-methylthioadenosine/S-adenosylhomocysteine deaminase
MLLAEGRRDNRRSTGDFDQLVNLGALTAAIVIIHSSALIPDQHGALADAGAKLVWSPQGNLCLNGETARAADALEVAPHRPGRRLAAQRVDQPCSPTSRCPN